MADYFAMVFDDDRIDRMPLRGSRDRGDVMGVRCHGRPVTIECKDCSRADLSGWVREAHLEAGNSDSLCGIVVFKRHGVSDPGSQWVVMEARDVVALLTGQTQDGCYD